MKSFSPNLPTHDSRRSGFTLVELLMVISILTILAALSLAVIRGANLKAKESRSESQIQRINEFLQYRWDEYEVRIMPYRISTTNREALAELRTDALLELIRAEMPYKKQYVKNATDPMGYYPSPAFSAVSPLHNAANMQMTNRWPGVYRRYVQTSQAEATWTDTNEQAECLYLILQSIIMLNKTGIDELHINEVGDTDGDGMLEVLDAFGDPLSFVIQYDVDPDPNIVNFQPVDFDALPYGTIEFSRLRFVVRSSRLDDALVAEDPL